MSPTAWALFDTAIGRCGIAWRGSRVIALALPEDDERATAAQLIRRAPGAERAEPRAPIADAIAAVQRLVRGEAADLVTVDVDLTSCPAFERKVYEALRAVAPGDTVTYGELAERVGSPGAARAVGMAMARNPVPVIIPCHRVLASGGRSGGLSAPGGIATKFRLLQIERAGNAAPSLFGELPLAVRSSGRRS